jgi:arylsulfatase
MASPSECDLNKPPPWWRLERAVVLLFVLAGLAACADRNTAHEPWSASSLPIEKSNESNRPNFLVIVADDLGYTDLGVYGSEIPTPNLDALARDGVLFTDFHSAPSCSPTRSMLLSGTDNHQAGLGSMAETLAVNQRGHPGYEGYLNFHVASLAEVLHDAGYHTYMTGKWHLGLTSQTGPAARGFERSFAMLEGGAGHFSNMLALIGPGKAKFTEDGQQLHHLNRDFYSSRSYAEKMIEYLKSSEDDGKPFFAYLAFQAPHWPLQAPEETISEQRGRYDEGYDVLHERRVSRLGEFGIIARGTESFPRLPNEPPWDSLSEEQKRVEARKMEIYAAMVVEMDRYVGKVVDYLKASNQFNDTFIFFMSDNGAEGHHLDRSLDQLLPWVEQCCDNSYENMGAATSYIWYGPNWGRAGLGPWRMFKGFTFEGGIKVPAFVHYPKLPTRGTVERNFLTVMDVMPTLLQIADVKEPGPRYKGRDIVPMQGRSMLALLEDKASFVHDDDHVVGWELFGKRGLRRGEWKLVYQPYHKDSISNLDRIESDTWLLFNLKQDPAEVHDVSAEHPEMLREMIALWQDYARNNGVIIPDTYGSY